MRFLHVASLPALIPAIFACTDQPAQQPRSIAARDSAGVTIVEVPLPELQGPALRIAAAPSVRIGVAQGAAEYQLHQVRGVRSLADSSILVLNAGTHELRRYDASGRWLSSSGRRGGGPGEMQFPLSLMAGPINTTWIFDIMRGSAFHVVDADGRIVDSRSAASALSGLVGILDSATAVIADPYIPHNIYGSVLTAEVIIATVDLDQAWRDTLLKLPGFQEYRYTHGELVRTIPVPFTSMPAVGVGHGYIYVADGRWPEVRVYNRDGALRRILRLQVDAVPVTVADWEQAIRSAMERRTQVSGGEGKLAPSEIGRQSSIFAALPRPETRPYFDRVYLESGGTIWLRRYTAEDEEQQWIGLSEDGEVRGVVTVPPRIIVREITEGWVLGQVVDELEVEYVVRYPLHRAH